MKTFPIFGAALLSMLFLGILVTICSYSRLFNWFPHPELGTVGFCSETVEWNGGEVGVCQYSSHPGKSWYRVEWHDQNGSFKILSEVGDNNFPDFSVDEGGVLTINYRDNSSLFDTAFEVVVTFRPETKVGDL